MANIPKDILLVILSWCNVLTQRNFCLTTKENSFLIDRHTPFVFKKADWSSSTFMAREIINIFARTVKVFSKDSFFHPEYKKNQQKKRDAKIIEWNSSLFLKKWSTLAVYLDEDSDDEPEHDSYDEPEHDFILKNYAITLADNL
jgi:hypothetical protein